MACPTHRYADDTQYRHFVFDDEVLQYAVNRYKQVFWHTQDICRTTVLLQTLIMYCVHNIFRVNNAMHRTSCLCNCQLTLSGNERADTQGW